MAAPALSNYLRDALIEHMLGTPYTAPTTYFLAIFEDIPTAAGGGTEAGTYTRPDVTADLVFDGADTGTASNSATVVTVTALPDGTYRGAAIYDAVTAGNMLWFGALTSPKTVTDGTLPFPIGNLRVGFE